jgi:Subtilase family
MGINISGIKATPYASTSVVDNYRWHGLAVTTLLLGGYDLERLRHAISFPLAITEASLVPFDKLNYVINPGHLDRALLLAHTPANTFQVINLSLATDEPLNSLANSQVRNIVIVSAAGNDTAKVDPDKVTWPAALGGKPRFDETEHSVFITVGAHDADGALAEFSNYGMAVDLLAPGCRLPSYKLSTSQSPQIVQDFVTGTSFAAPLVSFAAALLDSSPRFHSRPGLIKTRIITSTDFEYVLLDKTYSSGILDIPKALASKFDVIQAKGEKEFSLGLDVTPGVPSITCGHETIDFENILKLSVDDDHHVALMFTNRDLSNPSALDRRICDISELPDSKITFSDVESGKQREVYFKHIIDYVRHL